ncbi:MAG: hypothetical protein COA36_14660 [Desulfotalea sp.]|nr:MAG: hypothetical protein COA36_14660 [Desulfotalea sp.]
MRGAVGVFEETFTPVSLAENPIRTAGSRFKTLGIRLQEANLLQNKVKKVVQDGLAFGGHWQ